MDTSYCITKNKLSNNKISKPILVSNECIICFNDVNEDCFINCKTCNKYYCVSCLKEWKKRSNSNICTYCQQPTLKKHKNYFNILKKCFISFLP